MKRYTVNITVTIDADSRGGVYYLLRTLPRLFEKTDMVYVDSEDVSSIDCCDCGQELLLGGECSAAHLHDED